MARVIRYFAVNPDATPHVRALERATGLRPRSLQNELSRLVGLGVLDRAAEGRLVRYRLVESHPAWPPLRQLVRYLSEPTDVLPFALSQVAGVDAAFVFGSHARGTARPDSDVDLFVLGDVDQSDLARHTLEASVLLGREVNLVTATSAELARKLEDGSRIFRDLLAGAKHWVRGSPAALPLPTPGTPA